MRSFFLFYLLAWLFRNPLLALVVVGLLFYLGEARYRGRYFNPARMLGKRQTIAQLRRLLEVNPNDVAAHNDLGRLLADAGGFVEALPHMTKAIARMQESAETNYYYGLCLLRTGRAEEGEVAVAQALSLNPRFLYGEPRLALARSQLERGNAARALEEATSAVGLNTSSVEGWVLKARAGAMLERSGEARSDYEEAKHAFAHLPRHLRLPNRRWLREAKRGLRSVPAQRS